MAGHEPVFAILESDGMLLLSDATLPSLVALIAGEPVRGSWWSHPRSHEIFAVTQKLEHHPDVTTVKLLSGKVTFVHRKLWPSLVAVARCQEPWQMKGLSAAARDLLAQVDEDGRVRTDRLRGSKGKKVGDLARQLEAKLLVHAEEVHTETGAHAKALESWDAWRKRVDLRGRLPSVEKAKRQLEEQLERHAASSRLPWL